MPLRPRCLSKEEEGKAEEIREEEAEAKTEVEGTALHIHMEGATVKITAMTKAAANRVVNRMHKDKGMTNPMSNVIIARNMGTMPMNVGKIKMT